MGLTLSEMRGDRDYKAVVFLEIALLLSCGFLAWLIMGKSEMVAVADQEKLGNSYTFQEALPCITYIVLWIYTFGFVCCG